MGIVSPQIYGVPNVNPLIVLKLPYLNNIQLLYSAQYISDVSKRFTDILLPRSLDLVLARTHCVQSLPPGEHSSQA